MRNKRYRCARGSAGLKTGRSFQERGPDDWLADDDALGVGDTDLGAELHVAAEDELAERVLRQPRLDRAFAGWRELRPEARQRVALLLVVIRDVDDEGRRVAVVDEVVADPVRTPGVVARFVAAQLA